MNRLSLVCAGGLALMVLTLVGCATHDARQRVAQEAPHNASHSAPQGAPQGAPQDALQVWQGWQTFHFPGKRPTHYQVDQHEGRSVVMAHAERAVSLFRKNERIEPEQLKVLQFSWKVPQLIIGADLALRDKADSPARLVLAFEGDRSKFSMKNAMLSELASALTGEPMPYATLMYVWSNAEPIDTVIQDPGTDRIRKVVVASGPAQLNQWVGFERDVRRDFEKAFGEAPGALLSIGLMTDTDNTKSSVRAYYGPVAWSKP